VDSNFKYVIIEESYFYMLAHFYSERHKTKRKTTAPIVTSPNQTKMITRIKQKLNRSIEAKRSRTLLNSLINSKDECIKVFSKLLKDSISSGNHWTSEEKAAIGMVNQIREEYLASDETVNITDYGSGSSTSTRTKEEMSSGVKATLKISDSTINASTREFWGEIMFRTVRGYKPNNCLELGTNLGLSAAYQVSALKLNGRGKFSTIEGSAEFANQAELKLKRFQHPDLTIYNGRFIDILPGFLTSQDQALDFVFIDGHHDETATWEYYEMIYPYLDKKAILIFDDISWSDGMKQVWKRIFDDKRIAVSFDLIKWGVCFIDDSIEEKQHFDLRLEN
jgi:predicted O-methyltransferase YrrM